MRLPEKVQLVEAVVLAGPVLQTLLLVGPLPRWRNQPPPAPADLVMPPFDPDCRCRRHQLLLLARILFIAESNCSGGVPSVAA
ncbi:hypothetical protein ACQ4PT_042079 [Festuca glaucescens]